MEGLTQLSSTLPVSILLPVAARVLTRPTLWPTALRQAHRLAGRGWWRRPPFLPIPDRRYAEFRMTTMYGPAGAEAMEPDDVIEWLEWCRRWSVESAS